MRYYADPQSDEKKSDGSVTYMTGGYFSSLAKIQNCLCEDSKRRTIQISGEPDIAFSVPAVTWARKKTVSGYLTYRNELPFFVATGKNKGLIEKLTCQFGDCISLAVVTQYDEKRLCCARHWQQIT